MKKKAKALQNTDDDNLDKRHKVKKQSKIAFFQE